MKRHKNTTLNFRGSEVFKGPNRVAYFTDGGIFICTEVALTITELDQINTHGKSLAAKEVERKLSIAS